MHSPRMKVSESVALQGFSPSEAQGIWDNVVDGRVGVLMRSVLKAKRSAALEDLAEAKNYEDFCERKALVKCLGFVCDITKTPQNFED